MQTYRIKTTVDITRTRPDRHSQDQTAVAQQQNFNTLLQGIELRANIGWDEDPQRIGDHWIWYFSVEAEDLFDDGDDAVGLLKADLHNIPVIGNLTNPIAVYPAAFRTLGRDTNTWIEIA